MAECGAMRPPITAGTIGYTLAPRINAAGRMGHVEIATELFLTNDAARAVSLASQLCKLNRKRQDVESGIYKQAVSMLPPEKRRRPSFWPTKRGTRAWSASSRHGWPRNTAVQHF